MIKIDNLTKTFEGRTIFSQLNLTFQKGKVYALIGESGSGKTTLLNILANLENFDEGEVLYDDKPINSIKSQDYFRNYLGYLFQNFGLLESQTIRENLDLGLVGQKLDRKEREKQQLEALDQVALTYLNLDQKIYTISGGEAQRVALAKVILKNPPLILADEPTVALDPNNASEVMSLLLSLKDEKRIIIIATYNPSVWEQADRIIKLDDVN
ncbi:ABC transporter ATP-binding protein [Aerococcaceae bacterium WGS1372]